VLVLGVGVAMLFEQQKADNREAARYGDFKEKVQLLKNAVLKDRCNTATSVELSRVLVSTGHVDEAAAQLNEVVENCPADGSILTRLSRLYRKLGDHAEASRAASKLVTLLPRHASSYALRAELFEDRGQFTEAIADYRSAIELNPAHAEAAQQLSGLLEKNGKYCGAADILDQYLAHAGRVNAEELRRRSRSLRDSGKCSRNTLENNEVYIPVRYRGNVMLVDAVVNGYKALLVVDTGASSVALTRKFANRLKLDTSKGTEGMVYTASGPARVTYLQLDTVAVGSVSLKRVGATVSNRMKLGNVDGLLGNTFLSHFEVRVDNANSRLVLKKR